MTDVDDLVSGLLDGDQRALARVITVLENRGPGHRELVAALYRHDGDTAVVGVTGSPGVGKSTLVDRLVAAYREQGETVGVVAVDPSSPFTGGALLGDRVRVASAARDDGVFFRSMSARGARGGLAAATMDAVRAMSVAGMDRVVVETVGAGQGEVDVAGTADTVVVVVQPAGGDDVQALKAGILEIGDVYVVNKADRPEADRAVRDLHEMVEAADGLGSRRVEGDSAAAEWEPPVVETVATEGHGTEELLAAIEDHRGTLEDVGFLAGGPRRRAAAAIRAHAAAVVRARLDRLMVESDGFIDRVASGETDPRSVAEAVLGSAAEPDSDEGHGDDRIREAGEGEADR